MIARAHRAHQRGGDGGHAGGGTAGGFRPLKRTQALFQHRHGGVGEAGVDEARILAHETLFALLGGIVDMALREEQRLGGFSELRAQGAGVNKLGFDVTGLLGHGIGLRKREIGAEHTRVASVRKEEQVSFLSDFVVLIRYASTRACRLATGFCWRARTHSSTSWAGMGRAKRKPCSVVQPAC